MEYIKIVLPYDGIDEKEFSEFIKDQGGSVCFDEVSNMSAVLVCAIISSIADVTQMILAINSKYGDKLSNRKVTIENEKDEILKTGVKFKNIKDVISQFTERRK